MKHLNRFRIICLAAALLLSCCGFLPAAAESAPEEELYARLVKCRDQIAALTDFRPEIVLVLGTGLGGFTESESLEIKAVIPCREIEGWPVSTAPGHEGRLIFAEYRGLRLAIQQGRVHYYEGYTQQEHDGTRTEGRP